MPGACLSKSGLGRGFSLCASMQAGACRRVQQNRATLTKKMTNSICRYEGRVLEERRARLIVCSCVCSQGREVLMRKTVTQCAIVAAALCSIIFVSCPSFPSTLGIVSEPQSVDRFHKGDRVTNAPTATKNGPTSQPSLVGTGKQVPIGCDRAFSSTSSPQFSTIFGRCLV